MTGIEAMSIVAVVAMLNALALLVDSWIPGHATFYTDQCMGQSFYNSSNATFSI